MNKGLSNWADRAWIKFGCTLTAAMTLMILYNWRIWSTDLKVIAAVAALIPVHVIEEWVFPGGFHHHYNALQKSDQLDRYPMNRVSDMITNLFATFLYLGTSLVSINHGVSKGVILATLIFSALEVILHTIFGIWAYQTYRHQGKSTIYAPGSITAYLGFGGLGVILWDSFKGSVIRAGDWLLALGFLAALFGLGIILPESKLKSKSSPYYFESQGYYQRFLK